MSAAMRGDALVFFGATGDLAFKQIFPALQRMIQSGDLDVPVVGVAREHWDLEKLRARARESLEASRDGLDPDAWAKLSDLMRYAGGDYDDAQTYVNLRDALGGCGRPIHYLAIPPDLSSRASSTTSATPASPSRARVVVEKPFGRDLASARALNYAMLRVFPEHRVFRIDHFLGKSPVDNILFFRFANASSSRSGTAITSARSRSRWPRTSASATRGKFYEGVGAIRDVIENHLFQVLTLLAMDPSSGSHADAVREEKARFLRGVRTLAPEDLVRGQYRGYREADGVDPQSTVETYAALRLNVDSWRWADVPILVRAGKCLPVKATEIVVELKRPPERLFPMQHAHGNRVRFQIDPDVAIGIEVQARRPDTEDFEVEDVELVAMRETAHQVPPYQRLLTARARGRARAVRELGDDRGGLADRRPGARRRDPRPPVRAGQLGAGAGRRAHPRGRLVRAPPPWAAQSSSRRPRKGDDMTSPTKALHDAGQSLWLDNITRTMLDDGELAGLIDELGISGLTSNPSIFAKALAEGHAYDAQVRELHERGLSDEEVFFEVAIADLRRACDLFLPAHERSAGFDGWVSLEVSPKLAYDTDATIAQARSLHLRVDRSNLFVKIPGTPEGLPAIEAATHAGCPVNVTLLFDRDQYLAAADAYLRGLERRVADGLPPDVCSVASLFMSRWDGAVQESAPEALRGKLALAVGGRAFKAYRDLLRSDRMLRLMNLGARPQRLLWASTSTKDPSLPDTLYVDGLFAPFTVNTLPDSTLEAVADHGTLPERPLPEDGVDAEEVLDAYEKAGTDVDALAAELQRKGADAFVASWTALLETIASKRAALAGAS